MSQLSRNIVFGACGKMLATLAGVVLARIVFRGLGAETLGIVYFAGTIQVVFCSALELGIGVTLVREISRFRETDRRYLNQLIGATSFLYWTVAAIGALGVWLSAEMIVARWIQLERVPYSEAVYAIRILAVTAMFGLPDLLYTSVLQGVQRLDTISIGDLVISVLRAVVGVILVQFGYGLEALSTCFGILFLIQIMIHYGLCRMHADWVEFKPKLDVRTLLIHRRFAGGLMFLSIASLFYNQYEQIVVSKYLPLAVFGMYGVIVSLATKPMFIVNTFFQSFLSPLSELHGRGEIARQTELIFSAHQALCYLLAITFSMLAIMAMPILSFMMSPAAAKSMTWPFYLMLAGYYLNTALSVPYFGTMAQGNIRYGVINNMVSIPIMSIGLVILVQYWGVTGAACATLLSNIIWALCTIKPICRDVDIRVTDWIGATLRPLLLCAVSFGPLWLLIRHSDRFVIYGLTGVSLAICYWIDGDRMRTLVQDLLRFKGDGAVAGASLAVNDGRIDVVSLGQL